MTDTTTTKTRISFFGWLAMLAGTALMGYLIYYNIAHLNAGHGGSADVPPLWGLGVVPFVALLGCIAILPLLPATHHWWESNLNRLGIALLCGGATLVYYYFARGADAIIPTLNHAVPAEYVPFIVLLFSLYVISGGISLKGDLAAHPSTNTAFLAFGALIASFVGTTGASMLLIRPLLQTNSERKHVVHTVVFFIFLVSNIGGCLLPIGDPPLFLGYLRGVAFFWTFNLWMDWAFCCIILLAVYYVFDTYVYRKKEAVLDLRRDETEKQPLRLTGGINILWLAGIVVCVAMVNHETTLIKGELTSETTIEEINGGRGAELGTIYISDSSHAAVAIDLSGAHSMGEVVGLINGSEGVRVSAEIVDGGLVVRDEAAGEGQFLIADAAVGHVKEMHEADDPPDEAEAGHEGGGTESVEAAGQEEEGGHAEHAGTTAKDLGIAGVGEEGVLTGSAINPGWTPFPFLRELIMFLLVGISLISTPKGVREDNQFNYAAILEVAALFIGIFIAMQVPIEVLRVYGPDLGLEEPWHFFWATGSLSSFLDNAPTYVVFFETAHSLPVPAGVDTTQTIISPPLLVGISLGAVFMGAMTYIGNGPNFMVKAIAEQSGVKMPSFFGYMFKYSIPLLIPVFIIVTVLLLPDSGHGDATPEEVETPAVHVEEAADAGEPGH